MKKKDSVYLKMNFLYLCRCFLIAVGISLFWVILLRWLAAVLIWVTLFTFLGLVGFSEYKQTIDSNGCNCLNVYKIYSAKC